MRPRKNVVNASFGADSERTIQHGRFICSREGVERSWRVVSVHSQKSAGMVLSLVPFERRSDAYASLLVCDGCSHRFDVEAGRPMEEAERNDGVGHNVLRKARSGHERRESHQPVCLQRIPRPPPVIVAEFGVVPLVLARGGVGPNQGLTPEAGAPKVRLLSTETRVTLSKPNWVRSTHSAPTRASGSLTHRNATSGDMRRNPAAGCPWVGSAIFVEARSVSADEAYVFFGECDGVGSGVEVDLPPAGYCELVGDELGVLLAPVAATGEAEGLGFGGEEGAF